MIKVILSDSKCKYLSIDSFVFEVRSVVLVITKLNFKMQGMWPIVKMQTRLFPLAYVS